MQIFSFIIGMAFGAFFTILTIIVLSDMKEDKRK